MTEYVFANMATSTLATGIGEADASFTAAAGDGALFPSPDVGEAFYVVLTEDDKVEWMLVTGRSGDVFSGITRGADPQAFGAGATVKHAINATIVGEFVQQGASRTVEASPDGSLAPLYAGEEVYSTTGNWWKNTTGTEWKQVSGVLLPLLPNDDIEIDDVFIYDGWAQGTAATYGKIASGVNSPTDTTFIGSGVGGDATFGFESPGYAIRSFTLKIRAYCDDPPGIHNIDVQPYLGDTPFADDSGNGDFILGSEIPWENEAGDHTFHEYTMTWTREITAAQAATLRIRLDFPNGAVGAVSEMEIFCEIAGDEEPWVPPIQTGTIYPSADVTVSGYSADSAPYYTDLFDRVNSGVDTPDDASYIMGNETSSVMFALGNPNTAITSMLVRIRGELSLPVAPYNHRLTVQMFTGSTPVGTSHTFGTEMDNLGNYEFLVTQALTIEQAADLRIQLTDSVSLGGWVAWIREIEVVINP